MISVKEQLANKEILITGATGFVGKVLLAILLERHPEVGRIHLLIRPKKGDRAPERFARQVLTSPLFGPMKERLGEEGFAALVRSKVAALEGDVGQPNFGLSPGDLSALRPTLDLLFHCAGDVNFTPPLDAALDSNVAGPMNAMGLVLSCARARLVHVSTCYVAGCADGKVSEDREVVGFYPKREERTVRFDARREVAELQEIVAHVQRIARDQEREAIFDHAAREKLKRDARDPGDPAELEPAVERERKKWIEKRLSEEGERRAVEWGWPNTYAYTKSLGEQLLMSGMDRARLAIVRPAVVESSLREPFAGWNEGINTSAPLTYLTWRGHRFYPTTEENVLDIIPVDLVCNAMILVGAKLLTGTHAPVYQVGTSDTNGVSVPRLIELIDLSNREMYRRRTSRPAWENLLLMQAETVGVSYERYRTFSAPGVRKVARIAGRALEGMKPLAPLRKALGQVEKHTQTVERLVDLFVPFIYTYRYTFSTRNIRALRDELAPEERERIRFDPESIDWRHYMMRVHLPGLHKWTFPQLEEKFNAPKKLPKPYPTLNALLDGAAAAHEDHTALQLVTEISVDRWSYRELREGADRAAKVLCAAGIVHDDRVMLVSESRPEWAVAFFGILKAGGTAVPIDREVMPEALANMARASGARAVILSDKVKARLGAQLPAGPKLLTLDQLTAPHPYPPPKGGREARGADVADALPAPSEIASLIYTSGTTGTPKGVLLSHQNFTSLVAALREVFEVGRDDGFLSVLPLHHTFEFTTGLLIPLSRGATVTYLEEVNGESIVRALREEQVTCIVGVPALWQLLGRKIRGSAADRGARFEKVFNFLLRSNAALRDRLKLNVGKMLFAPVHRTLGGRMKYLISGGAALPSDVMELFGGLGFTMSEGYGLTEAAPVISVGKPGEKIPKGSVGMPVPGVEVKILDPGPDGVGEVAAQGPNVMRGYDQDPEATSKVLQHGWLRTGDLGKLDEKGRLTLVGRGKDVIVEASGKNVYPDELEEAYGKSKHLKELCVVGLPDGRGGERVGCLAVPDYAAFAELSREELQTKVREHFREASAALPVHQRIKVLRLWDKELPRTATRKVKRAPVRDELLRLLAVEEAAAGGRGNGAAEGWLTRVVAQLASAAPEKVVPGARLVEDLGFDSLLLSELAAAIEAHAGVTLEAPDLQGTVGDLTDRVGKAARAATALALRQKVETSRPAPEKAGPSTGLRTGLDAVKVPQGFADFAKSFLTAAQMAAYAKGFDVRIRGKANIPHNQTALVVSNHTSHLDMGLVKYALREWAPNLGALAARDYFFSTPARRFWFGNFTNVVSFDRSGNLDDSMREAGERLDRGERLLIFPEGTRSVDGSIGEFRRGLGFLVVNHKIDILPVFVEGTHRALPKGAVIPKARKIGVRIGPGLPFSWLMQKVAGKAKKEQYAEVAAMAREAVLALKRGQDYGPGAEAAAARRLPGGPAPDASLGEVFDELARRFQPGKAERPVSFYFALGDGARWTVVVNSEGCQVKEGKHVASADCVLKTSPEVFRKIVRERYVPSLDEFTSGKVKTNDPALLGLFQEVFKL